MNPEQLTQMQDVLVNALATDNTVRRQSEKIIRQHLHQNREIFVYGLIKLLRCSESMEVRTLCAILLRRNLPTGEPLFFDKLTPQLQATVKQELLQGLANEPERYMRMQICEAVAGLAEVLLFRNEWPELFPFLFQCTTTNETLMLCSLFIYGALSNRSPDGVRPAMEQIHGAYKAALNDPSLLVRSGGASACCSTLCNLEDDGLKSEFAGFVPGIVQVLVDLIRSNEEQEAFKLLGEVVEVASADVNLLVGHLELITTTACNIGQPNTLSNSLRQLALECLVVMAEEAEEVVRKNPGFIKNAVELSFTLMINIEEDVEWSQRTTRTAVTGEDGDESSTNFGCGTQAMDRLAQAIKGKKIGAVVFEMIGKAMKQEEWQIRHAGLFALTQVAEVLPYSKMPVKDVIVFTKDVHPRVQYAALECIGQLCEDFAFQVQHEHHQEIINVCTGVLTTATCQRVQYNAVAALYSFVQFCEPAILRPYLDQLANGLVQMFASTSTFVQEQILLTFAALAGNAPDQFANWYSKVLPLLCGILTAPHNRATTSLKGRAVESLSVIVMALGPNVIQNDVTEIMRIFMMMLEHSQQTADDVNQQYVLQAFTRVCQVLKADFLPYMQVVMELILPNAAKHHDWAALQRTKPGVGSRVPSAALTSALEEKSMALSMIASFVHELGGAYAQWLDSTVKIVLPLHRFLLNKDIRVTAIAIGPELLACALAMAQEGKAPQEMVTRLFREVTKEQLDCFDLEPELDVLLQLVGSFQMCISSVAGENFAKECFDSAALETVGKALLKLLHTSANRILKRKEREDKGCDEEMLLELQAQNATEDELNMMVCECVTTMMKTQQEKFIPVFNLILPEIERLLNPELSTDESQKLALYIVDDFVEHCGLHAGPYFRYFIPAMLQRLGSPNPSLLQAAAYGVGVCAKHGGQHFEPFLEESVKVLSGSLSAVDTSDYAVMSAVDNIISAIGRIAQFQNQPQLLPVWVSHLPLKFDVDEGYADHSRLCGLVECLNEHIFGDGVAAFLPHLLRVFAYVLNDESLTEDDLSSRCLAALCRIHSRTDTKLWTHAVQQQSAQDVELIARALQAASS